VVLRCQSGLPLQKKRSQPIFGGLDGSLVHAYGNAEIEAKREPC
jgi:hypothetical protein